MLTVTKLARAWSVSHQYVSKLAKKGMPLDSVEAADAWREFHAASKQSTNPTRIARIFDEEQDTVEDP
jgi:hypothetical protein